MNVWIKICGLTTQAAVHAAVEAGVDAIGFVLAPSKRQVTPEQAAELAREVPSHVARVAVMLHPAQALVDEVCSVMRPDVLQTDYEDLMSLRTPDHMQVMPVLRAGRAALSQPPTRILFEGAISGAGATADWNEAASLAKTTQLVLAGGLNPANVADAIARVQPFGVDVSSGVEAAPGVKDAQRIYEFVRNARAGAHR